MQRARERRRSSDARRGPHRERLRWIGECLAGPCSRKAERSIVSPLGLCQSVRRWSMAAPLVVHLVVGGCVERESAARRGYCDVGEAARRPGVARVDGERAPQNGRGTSGAVKGKGGAWLPLQV